jgi:hypothetical protein
MLFECVLAMYSLSLVEMNGMIHRCMDEVECLLRALNTPRNKAVWNLDI